MYGNEPSGLMFRLEWASLLRVYPQLRFVMVVATGRSHSGWPTSYRSTVAPCILAGQVDEDDLKILKIVNGTAALTVLEIITAPDITVLSFET